MHHVSYSFLSGFKVLRIKLQDGLVWWPPKQTRSLKLLYFWVIAQLLSHVWLFAISWTIQPMRLLCLRFPRQEYWSGLTFPSPGHLPLTEIKPMSLALSDSSPVSHQGSPYLFILKKILVLYSYFFFFFFLAVSHSMLDLSSPTRGQTHAPLLPECRILTTGLPGDYLCCCC